MGKFTCEICGKKKDYMDMTNEKLCKDCWIEKEDIKYDNAGSRTWKMRYEKYGPTGHS